MNTVNETLTEFFENQILEVEMYNWSLWRDGDGNYHVFEEGNSLMPQNGVGGWEIVDYGLTIEQADYLLFKYNGWD